MKVFGAKYNGYMVFDYMATKHPSEKVMGYSLPKLKKLGLLCGSEDMINWQGKTVTVNLSVDKKDPTKNMNWGFSECVAVDNTPVSNNSTPSVTASDLPF